MSTKIQLTPAELQAQAAEMKNLEDSFSSLFANISSDLKSVNNYWSPLLANNFEGKINSVQKTFTQLTQELANGSNVANTCAVTFESVDSELAKLYCTDIPNNTTNKVSNESYIENVINAKLQEFIDIINGDGSVIEKKDAIIAWLNSLRKDWSTVKDYLSWIVGVDGEFPEPAKSFFTFIKHVDIANKLGPGYVDWLGGLLEGDIDKALAGEKKLFSGSYSLFSGIFKSDNMGIDFQANFILDYGKNMVTNWLDSIRTESKVSEVYWNTFANSLINTFTGTVCNTPTLVLGYLPAKGISALFGFDLQKAYENVSDKKGFAAVTDSFSQLGELFLENSSWENWKSGMKILGDKIGNLLKFN